MSTLSSAPWMENPVWYVVCYETETSKVPLGTKVIRASGSDEAKKEAASLLSGTGKVPTFFKIRKTVFGERSCRVCSEVIRRGEVCPSCRKEIGPDEPDS